MRLIAYLRVSTEEQADSGLGLEAQQQACRQYCELYGHQLVATAQDVCSGSIEPTERPGWSLGVEAELKAGVADGVIFLRLDRLGRTVSGVTQVFDRLEKRHAVISVKEQFDTNSPMGRFMLHIMAAFAQFERDVIRARTVEAMAAKKLRGEQVGRVAIIPHEAVLLAEQLYYSDSSRPTWREVAALLAEAGYTNNDKKPFHDVTVMRAVGRYSEILRGDVAVSDQRRKRERVNA